MAAPQPPLVSVLTPVYNGEAYLAECIESVLAQTYAHWEYVIVNNCSTDRSLAIAEHYAARDARIRLHRNTEFLPALANLNHAFRQISPASKYCKVIHADDWVFPECVERMVAVAEAHPSAGLVSAYRLDEAQVNLDGLPYPSPVTNGREIGRRYLLDDLEVFGSPSSLLLESSLIRRRPNFYDEGVYHADTAVCLDILREHDLGFVHQVLTFTRRHNESRSSNVHRFSTRRLAKLFILFKYGPVFLTEVEYRRRRAQLLEFHYRFLARCALELRERAFWDFQRRELRRLGCPLSWPRLLRALLVEMTDVRQAYRAIRSGFTRQGAAEGGDPHAKRA